MRAPGPTIRSRNSATIRVLPMPASPWTKTVVPPQSRLEPASRKLDPNQFGEQRVKARAQPFALVQHPRLVERRHKVSAVGVDGGQSFPALPRWTQTPRRP
jgi:hypothetical protein